MEGDDKLLDFGPQRAAPKSVSAINAEVRQLSEQLREPFLDGDAKQPPLHIKLVQGWSVCLSPHNDSVFKWKAKAIRYSESEDSIGRDEQSTLSDLAHKCGMLAGDMLKAFGLITEH